jgi:molecular chaperone HtpG
VTGQDQGRHTVSEEDVVETLEFQAEVKQLLQLVIHSVYSSSDLFLRELVSNGADALDKLRLESFRDKDLEADTSDLHLEIVPDAGARTLTVRDNGIGMDRDEVVALIGTIARSGTSELAGKLRQDGDPDAAAELIGRVGIGFYSGFMVADEVTLETRRAGTTQGSRWSSTGESTYTLEDAPDAPVGTSVTLKLKPVGEDGKDYTSPEVLKEIVRRHSGFVAWPVRLVAGEGEPEVLNSPTPVWRRDKATDEEYAELYRQVGDQHWGTPLLTVPLSLEGRLEFKAVLFVPPTAPSDFTAANTHHGPRLYVRNVLVVEDCTDLVPPYLRFVRGVVDAPDLPLTLSRENIQSDPRIDLIRRQLTKKMLSALEDLEPEKYAGFWEQFGAVLKEGLIDDSANRATLLRLGRFASTHSDELTTLADYVERMPEGQTEILYVTGAPVAVLRSSPHLEAHVAAGREVLLLGEPVDPVWVEADPTFTDLPFTAVAASSSSEDVDPADAERYAPLLGWVQETLGGKVGAVRLSRGLTSSPARLVEETRDFGAGMDAAYRYALRSMLQAPPTLELNPRHALIERLATDHAALLPATPPEATGTGAEPAPDDAANEGAADTGAADTGAADTDAAAGTGVAGAAGGESAAELRETVELLFDMASLAEGRTLEDPGRFVRAVADRLA